MKREKIHTRLKYKKRVLPADRAALRQVLTEKDAEPFVDEEGIVERGDDLFDFSVIRIYTPRKKS